MFDFHNNPTIPIESNVDTLCRPDTVIYSVSKKIIIWFELTVPLERNIFAAAKRKRERYSTLKADLEVNGWIVNDFTIEIGALGFVAKSFHYALGRLGFSGKEKKKIRLRASKIALRSSFYIWSNRFNSDFIPPVLVSIPVQTTYTMSSGISVRAPSNSPRSPRLVTGLDEDNRAS